ncbi:MAG: hypothetical protein NZ578_11650 [Candidatus Binatia bacterium]|nr:hypothetical protein [Candidatus Binatia bacterium]
MQRRGFLGHAFPLCEGEEVVKPICRWRAPGGQPQAHERMTPGMELPEGSLASRTVEVDVEQLELFFWGQGRIGWSLFRWGRCWPIRAVRSPRRL